MHNHAFPLLLWCAMLITVRWTFFVAFLVAVVWAVYRPGFDSIASTSAALAAFLASFFLKKDNRTSEQVQNVSKGVGIQAGGDVKVRDIK